MYGKKLCRGNLFSYAAQTLCSDPKERCDVVVFDITLDGGVGLDKVGVTLSGWKCQVFKNPSLEACKCVFHLLNMKLTDLRKLMAKLVEVSFCNAIDDGIFDAFDVRDSPSLGMSEECDVVTDPPAIYCKL